MTPSEFKHLRESLGFTHKQMALALNLKGKNAANHIRKIENGLKEPSGPILRVIDYINKYGVL